LQIKELVISNLLSYKQCELSFGKYNVITGINDAGKSILFKLLRLVISAPAYSFSTIYVENNQKFDKNKSSWINIRIKFSTEEALSISDLFVSEEK
jgi:AAA15 family ATPase/GTPase